MSASPVSSRWICPVLSIKRTVKIMPSSRFACQSIPPAVSILRTLIMATSLIMAWASFLDGG